MVAARAVAPADGGMRIFDVAGEVTRIVRSCSGEHLLVDRGSTPIRLDIIEGTVSEGPVSLHFNLPDDNRLADTIAAIRILTGRKVTAGRHMQLASRLDALHAIDARRDGASLREISNLLLAPGEWPGDGEHRKSLVRRMITTGERMVRAGPRAILQGSCAKWHAYPSSDGDEDQSSASLPK